MYGIMSSVRQRGGWSEVTIIQLPSRLRDGQRIGVNGIDHMIGPTHQSRGEMRQWPIWISIPLDQDPDIWLNISLGPLRQW